MCRDDAAYVLGALSPADRHAYEDHLHDCATCQASVQRIAGLPGLLALTTATAVEDEEPPVPDTVLLGLISRVRSARRRRGWLIAGALAASVAAILALVVTVLVRPAKETADDYSGGPTVTTGVVASSESGPADPTPGSGGPDLGSAGLTTVPMTQVLPSPMTASLELVDKKWGTAITVVCQYEQDVDASVAYDLAVIDTDGHLAPAGSWLAVPGATSTVTVATAVPRDRIATLEVRLPDGRPILQSTP